MTSIGDLASSPIAAIAMKHWAGGPAREGGITFDASIVQEIYQSYLSHTKKDTDDKKQQVSRVSVRQMLEFTSYLEYYLWPHFTATASFEHVMSIIMLVNEKAKDALSHWAFLDSEASDTRKTTLFFTRCVLLQQEKSLAHRETQAYLKFLSHCFASFEIAAVRSAFAPLVSLPLWLSVSNTRADLELHKYSQLKKAWAKIQKDHAAAQEAVAGHTGLRALMGALTGDDGEGSGKRRKTADNSAFYDRESHISGETFAVLDEEEALGHLRKLLEASFLPGLLNDLLGLLEGSAPERTADISKFYKTAERFLEVFIDLSSQLATRRFTHVLVDDAHLVLRAKRSWFIQRAGAAWSMESGLVSLSANNAGNSVYTPASHATAPSAEGRLFAQLLDILEFVHHFNIESQTGRPVSEMEAQDSHFRSMQTLQRLFFKHFSAHFPDLKAMALCPVGAVEGPETLKGYLEQLSDEQLLGVARRLRLLPVAAAPAVTLSAEEGSKVAAGTKRPRAAITDDAAPALPTQSKPCPDDRLFVLDLLLDAHRKMRSQADQINRLPLYPDERTLWDPHVVPASNLFGDEVLALPKLNLQFLTFYDYLVRSFHLFRLESAYGIRSDLVDAIKRMAPRQVSGYDRMGFPTTVTQFTGWARMAQAATGSTVVEVVPPRVGEVVPAKVIAEITMDLSKVAPSTKADWDALREHDVLFLVTIRAHDAIGAPAPADEAADAKPRRRATNDVDDFTFPSKYGVVHVRGCEVVMVLDSNRRSLAKDDFLDDREDSKESRPALPNPDSNKRTLRVLLDAAQYHSDLLEAAKRGEEHPYGTFNLVVRRRPEENNFKAVLSCIRDLINVSAGESQKSLPAWLSDVLLGYGNPSAAHYSKLAAQQARRSGKKFQEFDFLDTFVSKEHLIASFPSSKVSFIDEDTGKPLPAELAVAPPFRLRFVATGEGDTEIVAIPYVRPPCGPFPEDAPKLNSLEFTPVQAEAIKSGMHHGLTMVVGPPGTGKTDTAVQMIANLYHNFPHERILLVTHSNQALNDLFDKISRRDIKEHHLLRLGAGEADLKELTSKDFSKYGRVNFALERRGVLLNEVQRLAVSLGVPGDVGYTCETAEYFQLYHVTSRIEEFRAKFSLPIPPADGIVADAGKITADDESSEAPLVAQQRLQYRKKVENSAESLVADELKAAFPFLHFFSSCPGGLESLFAKGSAFHVIEAIEACFAHLESLFAEVRGYKAFELLRTQRSRTDYMLVKQARIIAMTCTHAAIARSHLIELGFKYDTLIMEEAAQVLEIETFIPMVLQQVKESEAGGLLKRVVLIGDHNQLPPIIQNMALQKFSHLDQSMFARLVRLGVPTIQLDRQGRCRSSIAKLYGWRYKYLTDMPLISTAPDYTRANAGFAHEAQIINVEDFAGKGENCPVPFFYQNLGEAEYVVAVYQYMRLCGYPAEKITILTTYNGQKQLIRDVVKKRCGSHPLFGEPARIETVDKYQGQQNDYVLLSLVRTRAVGHLRDIRRLVVALSRARLGLYVFCRAKLFADCYELSPAFSQLMCAPTQLQLVLGEQFPSTRVPGQLPADSSFSSIAVDDVNAMGKIISQVYAAQMMVLASQYSHLGATALPQLPAQPQSSTAAPEPSVPLDATASNLDFEGDATSSEEED